MPVIRRTISLIVVAIAATWIGCFQVCAATQLDVQVGWEGYSKSTRWTPFIITASDPTPRNVELILTAPHDGANAMVIRQAYAIGMEPTSIALFAPLLYTGGAGPSVEIKDSRTGKTLAAWDAADFPQMDASGFFERDTTHLIVVSGRQPALRSLSQDWKEVERTRAVFAPQRLLPYVAIGYDAVDVLVLNAPDFDQLDVQQQQAIADWVRGGGTLVFWPSEGPLPKAGPLVDVLPVQFGPVENLALSDTQRQNLSLPKRFAKLVAHQMTLKPEAAVVPQAGELGPIRTIQARVGFGQVLVFPTDMGLLQFEGGQDDARFWSIYLSPLYLEHPPREGSPYGYQDARGERVAREYPSLSFAMDTLGNVPGAGQFDFIYVVIVLTALILFVGPIDYLVLKRFGRLNWTWGTTSFWIIAVTSAGLLLGYLIKSGDLYFRTLRIVDQADGKAVAATNVFGIYSPRNDDYTVTGPAQAWWRPVSTDIWGYSSRNTPSTKWGFDQTLSGNFLHPVPVNIWNLRFARTHTSLAEPAQLEAVLTVRGAFDNEHNQVEAVLANRGPDPIQYVRLIFAGQEGAADLATDPILPGQTRSVVIETWPRPKQAMPEMEYWNRYYNPQPNRSAGVLGDLPGELVDLSSLASLQTEKLLARDSGTGCILALTELRDPAVKLVGHTPIEKHWQIIRALVSVRNSPGEPSTKPQ